MSLNYPLQIKFPVFVIGAEMHLEDAAGQNLMTFKQRALSLRESTTVFSDKQKTQPIFTMKADRVIGFGAKHIISRADGTQIGVFQNDGIGSLWRSRYTITDPNGKTIFKVSEENPWIAALDMVFRFIDEIPVIGLVGGIIATAVGYFINPTYLLKDSGGKPRYRIIKKRSILERRFNLEALDPVEPEFEEFTQLCMMRTVQLERNQG